MIKTFKHKGLREAFERGTSRHVDPKQIKRVVVILDVINRARTTQDIDQPGYRLHTLAPSRPNTWTIRLQGPFRITFAFTNGDAYDVDLEQYH
ncbi:MAG TPA: type II toxin-antitoxin system RelE/ParE family toxin [Xanthobacteraceae bacterium]|jgi:proteic killer suppression protein|nr:type II toxin-antitoxin system RelE/ParE family toxin [Xanthobacteraceae bacterium]